MLIVLLLMCADELSILEETIIKLKEICEEPGNQAISGIMNHQIDCEKVSARF